MLASNFSKDFNPKVIFKKTNSKKSPLLPEGD
jgi:hypothetical protein